MTKTMKIPTLLFAHYLAVFLCGSPAFAQHDHVESAAPPERLGTVHFPTSCSAAVQADFDRSVALLHSFWFSAAIASFEDVAANDPGCAMAYWGVAMSWWGNPFGGYRSPQALANGKAA
ncbi:MAG TPA: hypothetical protein VLB07_07725, partial [Woeseiaceae bacterium]|nr:hypothetical protein [Woeseiaceae bacterium]